MGVQRQTCCSISGGEAGPRTKTQGGQWEKHWTGSPSSDCPCDSGQTTSPSEPQFPHLKDGEGMLFQRTPPALKSLICFWGFCFILGNLETCQGTNIYRTLGILSGEVGGTSNFKASLCPPGALQGCSDIYRFTHRSGYSVPNGQYLSMGDQRKRDQGGLGWSRKAAWRRENLSQALEDGQNSLG